VPSQANFIFVRIPRNVALRIDPAGDGAGAATKLYDGLLRAGVIVRPMGAAGFADALRITIGLPSENARMLEALGPLLG
jgi:histidinol-phosphate aminotransferase